MEGGDEWCFEGSGSSEMKVCCEGDVMLRNSALPALRRIRVNLQGFYRFLLSVACSVRNKVVIR